MRINPIQLTSENRLINDYRNHEEDMMKHFDYSPFHDYEQRLLDLKQRTFKRKQLTELLYKVNKQWNSPRSTLLNIERLKEENSVVVIGGQQAGLMTGPMYTINKIISIIQLAKQQEEKLKVPVIPVFWIAGEDHDYDEINHIYLMKEQAIKQHQLLQPVNEKQSISDISIDESYANEWLDQVFEQLSETSYTKALYTNAKDCLAQSHTYVDFFARFIFKLFEDEGLILVDSDSKEIRELESDYFVKLIENQADISKGVHKSFQQLTQNGYSISLDVEMHDAHLFICENNERILLMKNEAGEWVGKHNEVKYTTEELLNIAIETPELLSNNVVTRPVMQELIFPTLSFIGGLGEISYWAVLKPAFQTLGIKMPPVMPRLSFTYVDQTLEGKLEKFSIDPVSAVNSGVEENKGNWLASQYNPPIHYVSNHLKQAINDAHRPLRNIAEEIRSDLAELANKNLEHLYRDIEFLETRIEQALTDKFKLDLKDFDLINNSLHPFGGLQERVWNPVQLINTHGISVFNKLIDTSCSFEEEHFLVYI